MLSLLELPLDIQQRVDSGDIAPARHTSCQSSPAKMHNRPQQAISRSAIHRMPCESGSEGEGSPAGNAASVCCGEWLESNGDRCTKGSYARLRMRCRFRSKMSERGLTAECDCFNGLQPIAFSNSRSPAFSETFHLGHAHRSAHCDRQVLTTETSAECGLTSYLPN